MSETQDFTIEADVLVPQKQPVAVNLFQLSLEEGCGKLITTPNPIEGEPDIVTDNRSPFRVIVILRPKDPETLEWRNDVLQPPPIIFEDKFNDPDPQKQGQGEYLYNLVLDCIIPERPDTVAMGIANQPLRVGARAFLQLGG